MNNLSRREFVQKISAFGLGSFILSQMAYSEDNKKKKQDRPNFIVVLANDIGAKELSCYGNKEIHTPNLDRMAQEGVKFETCYATPICHPTRVMLLTGQYGCHNGVYNFANRRGGPKPKSDIEDIAKSHRTFINLLKEAGYATAMSGKWQLSGELPKLIFECGFDEYCTWAYKEYIPPGVAYTSGFEGDGKYARYWHPSIVRNGEYIPTKPDDYGPDIHNQFVIDFLNRHKEQPFVIYYPTCLTHAPHLPTPDSKKDGDDLTKSDKKIFKDNVEYLDKLMGKLLEEIEKAGMKEKTIVIFTGDNGTGGSGKGQPTELGARVPMIIWGPGYVKQRGSVMELTDLSDILPTLCDWAGVPVPKDRPMDGVSLMPFLIGKCETTREWIFSFIADRRILRTKRWLLEDNSPLHYGRLYDCGDSRDGTGYKEVTNSDDPEVIKAKEYFNQLLEKLPAPKLDHEGPPTERNKERSKERKNKQERKENKAKRRTQKKISTT
ncbi:MAG TPA: sulfatase-like hydrolase/transferase [Candidatus Hydrogenedens sp.]|nr:sulfatase-like hydrolase/transferase [Candidatus Hydrogenedens sp.]